MNKERCVAEEVWKQFMLPVKREFISQVSDSSTEKECIKLLHKMVSDLAYGLNPNFKEVVDGK